MDRRNFLQVAGAATTAPGGTASKEDIQTGCEAAVAVLKGWLAAMANRDFDYLERHLSSDFVATVVPMRTASGYAIPAVRDKKAYMESDHHLRSFNIDVLSLTARRRGDIVVTVIFATLFEEFAGDLGPNMPSAEELTRFAHGKRLAYASGWKEIDGRWQCTSHHVLGTL